MEQLYCHGNVLPWCRGETRRDHHHHQGSSAKGRLEEAARGIVGFVFSGRKKKFLERIDLNGAGTIQKFLPPAFPSPSSLSLSLSLLVPAISQPVIYYFPP